MASHDAMASRTQVETDNGDHVGGDGDRASDVAGVGSGGCAGADELLLVPGMVLVLVVVLVVVCFCCCWCWEWCWYWCWCRF